MITYQVKNAGAKRYKLVSCSLESFLKINKSIVAASLLEHFIKYTQKVNLSESNIIVPDTKNYEYDLDIGPFFCRFLQNTEAIYAIFYKNDVKYSRQFICNAILGIYDILQDLFARSLLRMIYTTGTYYIVFKTEHNYDIELSLNDSAEKYGVLTKLRLKNYLDELRDEKHV